MSEESNQFYHRERKKLIEKLGGECEECGSTQDLHFHHVNPVENGSRGGMQQLYRVRKEVENGIEIKILCETCHKETHRERNDLEPLSSYMEEEIA